MKRYSDLEYLRLSKGQKFLYKLTSFFAAIPRKLWNLVLSIGRFFKNIGVGIAREISDLVQTFKDGDWKTRTSYLVMGFGSIARGQVLRGLLFLLFELVFIFYMIFAGGHWLSLLPSLGKIGPHTEYSEVLDTYSTVLGDNSFKILLYGVLTMFFIIAFLYTWRANIKQNKISEEILRSGKPLKSGKDDLRSLVDDNFHKTLLALPLTGILVFTVMPIVFMVLVAFTNYDGQHNGYSNALFTWVGLENFRTMFSWNVGGVNYAATFGEILTWTLIWAFFATFTNYFLGIFVAMMINKKGIHLKKMWRTILILTIAIPQFISLLYVSKMFDKNGIVNGLLMDLGWIDQAIDFWGSTAHSGLLARVMVILINIWIGIPYLMLIATGILMNIPADLTEAARIDGANAWQSFWHITMPYILFVMGPSLVNQVVANINNFNVIYLLSHDVYVTQNQLMANANASEVDLLITWLFGLTQDRQNYKMASVIGILVFVVCAIITLLAFNRMIKGDKEESFQ